MKNNKNCLLFYFTGTGNTYLVAKTVSNVFEKNNINVELIKIENFIKSRLNNNTDKISSKNKFLIDKEKLDKLINQSYKEIYLIGIVLPVALQRTYPFLWEGNLQKIYLKFPIYQFFSLTQCNLIQEV